MIVTYKKAGGRPHERQQAMEANFIGGKEYEAESAKVGPHMTTFVITGKPGSWNVSLFDFDPSLILGMPATSDPTISVLQEFGQRQSVNKVKTAHGL